MVIFEALVGGFDGDSMGSSTQKLVESMVFDVNNIVD